MKNLKMGLLLGFFLTLTISCQSGSSGQGTASTQGTVSTSQGSNPTTANGTFGPTTTVNPNTTGGNSTNVGSNNSGGSNGGGNLSPQTPQGNIPTVQDFQAIVIDLDLFPVQKRLDITPQAAGAQSVWKFEKILKDPTLGDIAPEPVIDIAAVSFKYQASAGMTDQFEVSYIEFAQGTAAQTRYLITVDVKFVQGVNGGAGSANPTAAQSFPIVLQVQKLDPLNNDLIYGGKISAKLPDHIQESLQIVDVKGGAFDHTDSQGNDVFQKKIGPATGFPDIFADNDRNLNIRFHTEAGAQAIPQSHILEIEAKGRDTGKDYQLKVEVIFDII